MIFFIAENDPLKNVEHSLELTDVGCRVYIKNCDVRKSKTYIAMNLTMGTVLSIYFKPLN
jgi:hypothetical protein